MAKIRIGDCAFRRTESHLFSSSRKGGWREKFELPNPTGLGNFLKKRKFSQNQIKEIYAFMRSA